MSNRERTLELLEKHAAIVATSQQGGRNDALYRESIFVAQFCKNDWAELDEPIWRTVFTAAANVAGIGSEAGRTLDSAWDAADPDAVDPWAAPQTPGPPPPFIGGRRASKASAPPPLHVVPDEEGQPQPLPVVDIEGDPAMHCVRYRSVQLTQGVAGEVRWGDLSKAVKAPLPAGTSPLPLWAFHDIEGNSRARIRKGGKVRAPVVTSLDGLMLDYDSEPGFTRESVRGWWGDVRYVAHTSRNHLKPKSDKPAGPRGRVILALSRPITPAELEALRPWLLTCGRGAMGDVELKSAARSYFVPVETDGYWYDVHDGDALDVDALLGAEDGPELADTEPDPDTWALLRTRVAKDGSIYAEACPMNLEAVFRFDPRWTGTIKLCHFTRQMLWRDCAISDPDFVQAAIWVHRVYGFKQSKEAVGDVWGVIARDNAINPVSDYLTGLVWDGKARLDSWLATYVGCPDDSLSAAMGRCWMISGVARILDPGCKVDTVLILVGPQGRGKSTALRVLAGSAWFADTPLDVRNKDAAQSLPGVWIYEWSELEAMRRAEKQSVKAWVVIQTDWYRPSYGRVAVRIPRMTVFAGTTNDQRPLSDDTGSRRWWPRTVGAIDLDSLALDRDQLWAEAVARYHAGEPWWFDADLEEARIKAAEEFEVQDPLFEVLAKWVVGKSSFSMAELCDKCLHVPADQTQRMSGRVGPLLRKLGWEPKQATKAPRITTWRPLP